MKSLFITLTCLLSLEAMAFPTTVGSAIYSMISAEKTEVDAEGYITFTNPTIKRRRMNIESDARILCTQLNKLHESTAVAVESVSLEEPEWLYTTYKKTKTASMVKGYVYISSITCKPVETKR